jgi:hypothetical protein
MSILEKRENDKYLMAYNNVGVEFKPLAMEMHGLTSDTFKNIFQETSSYRSE